MKKQSFVPVVPMRSTRQLPADYSDVPEWLRPKEFRKKKAPAAPVKEEPAKEESKPEEGKKPEEKKKSWLKRLLGAADAAGAAPSTGADHNCGAEHCDGAKKVQGPKKSKRKVTCPDVLGGKAEGDEDFCSDFTAQGSADDVNRPVATEQCDCVHYDKRGYPVTDPDCADCGGHGYAPKHAPAMEDDPRWQVTRPRHNASTKKRTAGEPIVTKTIGGKKFNFQGDKPWIHPSQYGATGGSLLSPEQAKKKQALQQKVLDEIAKLQQKEQKSTQQPGKIKQFFKNLVEEPTKKPQTQTAAVKETEMQTRIASIRVATPVLKQIARTGQFVYKGWLYTADAEKTQGKEPHRPDDADAAPFIEDTYDSRKSENPPKMDDLDFAKGKKPSFKAPGEDVAAPFVEDTPADYASEKPHPVKAARYHTRRGLSTIR